MKNKVFSGALFVENLKRYAGLIIAGFLVMFVSAPFELLTETRNPLYSYSFVENMLSDQNVGFLFVQFALPVCAAVAVFQYLYKVNSTSLVHAMPFSRTKLYVTNYISGLVIAFIPQLLNWILMAALKRPTYPHITIPLPEDNIYTFAACCEWLLYAFIIVFFTYSIAVLACMVAGNGVIATLTGFAFNVLVAALIVITDGYVVTNCYGCGEVGFIDFVVKTHPAFMIVAETIQLRNIIIFALIAVVIAIVGRYVYYLRKLERCGDSYVFTIMQDIIGFLFVLGASSATGLLLFEGMGFSAYLIGGLIGFVIGQMITRKTFRLWNKKTLKNFIIFFVLMVLIVCCFMFDVFGIEKRVPNEDKIEYAEYSESFIAFDGNYEVEVSDNPEVIKAVTGLHKDIISKIDDIKDAVYQNGYAGTESLRISYHLKNGTVISREYDIPYEMLAENENIGKLIELSGFYERIDELKKLSTDNLDIDIDFNYIYSSYTYYDGDDPTKIKELSDAQKQDIIDALCADMQSSRVTDRMMDRNELLFIRIEKKFTAADLNKLGLNDDNFNQYFAKLPGYNGFYDTDFGNDEVVELSFKIDGSYKNTIKVIEQISGKSMREILIQDDCIAIVGGNGDIVYNIHEKSQIKDGLLRNFPEEGDQYFTIDDTDLIFDILCEGTWRYDDRGFWVSVLHNESLGSVPAYNEIYTSWISADDLPEKYQAKVDKIIEYEKAKDLR